MFPPRKLAAATCKQNLILGISGALLFLQRAAAGRSERHSRSAGARLCSSEELAAAVSEHRPREKFIRDSFSRNYPSEPERQPTAGTKKVPPGGGT
jgi:hypothetical protein